MKISIYIFLGLILLSFLPVSQAKAGWTNYNSFDNPVINDHITSVYPDTSGLLWFGTNGYGIQTFDGISSWELYSANFPPGPINDQITDITGDINGNIWISTIVGLSKFASDSTWDEFDAEDSLLQVNINRVVTDSDGNIWLGTFGAGIVRFDGDTTWTYYDTDSGLANNGILSMYIDTDQNLWLGTYGGISKFDRGTSWTTYTSGNSGLPENTVHAITRDLSGNFWFGTDSGVVKFDGADNWTAYDTANSGIAPGPVLAITIDSSGNIWFGHEQTGSFPIWVSKFDGLSTWETHDIRYGVEVNISVVDAATDSTGKIWFATNGDGLSLYEPDPVDVTESENETIPSDYNLEQNYPNPFNASTIIRYSLPEHSKVTISIYNTLGQLTKVLVDAYKPAGNHTILWDGTDQNGESVVSGVYMYGIKAGNFVDARKMIMLK